MLLLSTTFRGLTMEKLTHWICNLQWTKMFLKNRLHIIFSGSLKYCVITTIFNNVIHEVTFYLCDIRFNITHPASPVKVSREGLLHMEKYHSQSWCYSRNGPRMVHGTFQEHCVLTARHPHNHPFSNNISWQHIPVTHHSPKYFHDMIFT